MLYMFSNFLGFLIHWVLRYRTEIVRENLNRVFPEKTSEELDQITKFYYRYVADMMVEQIKSFSISEKEAVKRCRAINPELTNEYFDKNQSLIMILGHNENWEWPALSGSAQVKHRPAAIYKPLNDKYLNNWTTNNRSRFGCLLLTMKETYSYYESKPKELTLNAFIADQSPGNIKNVHWVDFFGHKTAFLPGPALISIKHNIPIVYCNIRKVKRGYYAIEFEKFVDDPSKYSPIEITQKFAQRLEKQILENPHSWLWSHRRWKHKFDDHNEVV